MVFVYSDHYKCRSDLRGETCLKTMFLANTLGLGRLFCFQRIQTEIFQVIKVITPKLPKVFVFRKSKLKGGERK